MPAASAAFLTARHFLVVEPIPPNVLAPAGDAAEEAPFAIFENLIQVSSAASGQVTSAEPRPFPTSRWWKLRSVSCSVPQLPRRKR